MDDNSIIFLVLEQEPQTDWNWLIERFGRERIRSTLLEFRNGFSEERLQKVCDYFDLRPEDLPRKQPWRVGRWP
ncbi:hypothetical protein EDB95_0797 [Dinghuibacter silviterrae]|uniref:Uncharacterized protein n=1 Tax=Dinghuibacter silviterrae TaxID=1539049 RepID=A0A4R8DR27_9BACT|nr:hypothetical protein EDB95_0797 [Dinghuibacter silviterrae]